MSRRHPVQVVCAFVALAFVVSTGCNMLKPKPKKPFGEACENNLDCESMDCNVERGKFCTKACKADSDCGGEYVCAGQPTGTGGACAKKVGNPTGTPCADRAECDHGSCLKKGDDKNGFCSQRCNSANDCPDGYKDCTKISDMGAQKLCLPGAGAAAAPPPPAKPPAAPPKKK